MNDVSEYVDKYLKKIYKDNQIGDYGTNPYRFLNIEERDKWILFILKELENPLEQTGEHRKDRWECGWDENLKSGNFMPRYFNKYPIIRFNQKFITSNQVDDCFEYHTFCAIQSYLFNKYIKDVANIYEFGCGTGHNLFRMRAVNKKASLYGLDWTKAGVENVKKVDSILNNTHGVLFDMFKPNSNFVLKKDSVVITIASMEQLGTSFLDFVSYLLEQKPKLILHIEPLQDLLDPNNLLDYLSLRYMQKRNYISGYVQYLKSLDRVNIIEFKRSYVGSLFIDGYSLLVWKPI